MFSSATFISTYVPTDLGLVFVNTIGRRVRGINVCKYNDSGIDGNTIWVLLEGNEKIILDFATTLDANSALTLLRNAFDTLTPNCELGATPPPPAGTLSILSTTVAGYNILKAASQLTSFGPADVVQWYDVTDTGGVFGEGAGAVFRVLALKADDALPHGFNLTSKKWGTLDFAGNKFKNTFLNSYSGNTNLSTINSATVDVSNGVGTSIIATNGATISVGKNAAQYIIADGGTTISVDLCSNMFFRNCDRILVENSSNCYFDGLSSIDLTGHSWIFSYVSIDKSDTIGKLGYESCDAPKDPLLAYIDEVYQKVTNPAGIYDVIIRNPIPQANAEFNFIIPSNFTGAIRIKDYTTSSVLFTITAAHAGLTITFKFDKVTGLFYLHVPYGSNGVPGYYTCTPTAGQLTFASVLAFVPSAAAKSRLFLNGQKQFYGVDYSISGTTLLWVDVAYSLEITDVLELYYE